MLYERRILICCSKLSTVSENITAEHLLGLWRSSLDDDHGDDNDDGGGDGDDGDVMY